MYLKKYNNAPLEVIFFNYFFFLVNNGYMYVVYTGKVLYENAHKKKYVPQMLFPYLCVRYPFQMSP